MKLPVKMQNERVESTEANSTDEKKDPRDTDKVDDVSRSNDTDSSANASHETLTIVNNEKMSPSRHDEEFKSPEESLGSAPSQSSEGNVRISSPKIEEAQPGEADDESRSKDKESTQNDENVEGNEQSGKSKTTNEDTDEGAMGNTETVQDTAEVHAEETIAETSRNEDEKQEIPTDYSVAPPKPPRLKSADVDDGNNGEGSSKGNDDEPGDETNEEETKANNEQSTSAEEKSVEIAESSIEKLDEEAGKPPDETKTENGTQDDDDVVQSPAPRTG